MLHSGYLDYGRAEYSVLDVGTLREIYSACRAIVLRAMGAGFINAQVFKGFLPTDVDWIMAIKSLTYQCDGVEVDFTAMCRGKR